jgi:hypothetical protein
MSAYKTKVFARFARKAGIADSQLSAAAAQVIAGRFDADLGGGVYKQRVARSGGGKSGGFRTLLAFRSGGSLFFVYGFAKNAKANVTTKELGALQAFAALLLGYEENDLVRAVAHGELVELEQKSDGEEAPQA